MIPELLARAGLVGALLLLVGAPPTLYVGLFPEFDRRELDAARPDRISLALVLVASLVGLAGAAALAVIEGTTAAVVAGAVETVALGGVLALTALRVRRPESVGRSRWLGSTAAGAAVALLAFCATHYSEAVSFPALGIVVKAAHMGGASLWLGGLVVLSLLPSLLATVDEEATDLAAATVRRFSILAVAGVTIAFVTGVEIVAWHVPYPAALTTTSYGVVLLAKVFLVLFAAALGGFNRFVLCCYLDTAGGRVHGKGLPGLLVSHWPALRSKFALATFARAVRLELAVVAAITLLSVALTSVLSPSYILLGIEATASAESALVAAAKEGGFASVLELGAGGLAVAGALTLGYELGVHVTEDR